MSRALQTLSTPPPNSLRSNQGNLGHVRRLLAALGLATSANPGPTLRRDQSQTIARLGCETRFPPPPLQTPIPTSMVACMPNNTFSLIP